MEFICYYENARFAYLSDHFKKNGFKQVGNHIDGMRKVAVFIEKDFNFYIDCIDREYPNSAHGTVKHANGKPFLYFKTAYSPIESKNIINIIENGGGTIEPFFKWCGANLSDGFFKELYPVRKQFIKLQRESKKLYDIGYCCSFTNHAVKKVSELRMDFYNKFKNQLGDKFFHNEKLKYKDYIQESLKWKLSFNCPGVGEYTSRMMDSSSIGIAPLLRKTTYDNAISWKRYFPEIDFELDNWQNELSNIIDNYKEWGDKSLYYYETHWSSQAIFNYLMNRVTEFKEKLK